MDTTGKDKGHAPDQALAWIARLRADTVSAADRQAFALWLAEDDAHVRAMDEALELWEELGDMVAVEAANDAIEPTRRTRRWLLAAGAAAASVVAALLLAPQFDRQVEPAQFQSAMGERRSVELPDGSKALLNTNSAIRVSYSDDERHIELKRGEAWFQVHKDTARPFNVDAGGARVTALGTAFDVYRKGKATEVTVTEGVVRVTELNTSGIRIPSSEVLRKDQHLRASPEGWNVGVTDDVERKLAWREGRLVARSMPLPQLIAELQRYQDTSYLLADPELSALTVSGVFDLDQPATIVRALELSLNIEARPLDGHTVQLLKKDR